MMRKIIKGKRRNHPGAAGEQGFTLMEVLIAMTILSVGLLAIASMQISAIQTTGGAKFISKGLLWAEDRMEYLTSLPYSNAALDPGNNRPDPIAPSPAGYTISYNVQDDEPYDQCKLITLTVTWEERGINKATTLTALKPEL